MLFKFVLAELNNKQINDIGYNLNIMLP